MMETQDGNARSPPKSPASPPGDFWSTPPGSFVFGDQLNDPLANDWQRNIWRRKCSQVQYSDSKHDPESWRLEVDSLSALEALHSRNLVVDTALLEKNTELTAENERLLRRLEAAELNIKRGHRIYREPTDQELARLQSPLCKCVMS